MILLLRQLQALIRQWQLGAAIWPRTKIGILEVSWVATHVITKATCTINLIKVLRTLPRFMGTY